KTNLPGHSAENVFDYMVAPKFKLGKDQLLYARIATGYQPGGPNISLPGIPPAVKSSTVTSYEAGLKSEFFDHRLLFNIAGYHISWEDIQVSKVVNGEGAWVNAGKAETNGVELTTGCERIKNLRFAINGAYTDATLSNSAQSFEGSLYDSYLCQKRDRRARVPDRFLELQLLDRGCYRCLRHAHSTAHRGY